MLVHWDSSSTCVIVQDMSVYTTTVVDDLLALCCDMERMVHTSVGHQHFDAENFLVSQKECVDHFKNSMQKLYISDK